MQKAHPTLFGPNLFSQFEGTSTSQRKEEVEWTFTPDSPTNGQYGTLEVTYTQELTSTINGLVVCLGVGPFLKSTANIG